jgi:hypothetical protein
MLTAPAEVGLSALELARAGRFAEICELFARNALAWAGITNPAKQADLRKLAAVGSTSPLQHSALGWAPRAIWSERSVTLTTESRRRSLEVQIVEYGSDRLSVSAQHGECDGRYIRLRPGDGGKGLPRVRHRR